MTHVVCLKTFGTRNQKGKEVNVELEDLSTPMPCLLRRI